MLGGFRYFLRVPIWFSFLETPFASSIGCSTYFKTKNTRWDPLILSLVNKSPLTGLPLQHYPPLLVLVLCPHLDLRLRPHQRPLLFQLLRLLRRVKTLTLRSC